MSFQDVMRIFRYVWRTRLFDEKWTVVQQWNSINVGWIAGYLDTKFIVEVKKAGTVVVVLSQVREVSESDSCQIHEADIEPIPPA